MKKPEDLGPQTKKSDEERALELDKQTLKDLEPDVSVEEAVKGGRAGGQDSKKPSCTCVTC